MNKNLISLCPQGVISNLTDLRAVDIAYTEPNSTVWVLGSGVAGDMHPAQYRYVPSSTDSDDGLSVIEPASSTGAWLQVNAFSGRYAVTTSITGFQEDFIAFSGNTLTYTLPPVWSRQGKTHTVMQLLTGVISVTGGTANQLIYANSPTISYSFENNGGSGNSRTFLAANGIYYVV